MNKINDTCPHCKNGFLQFINEYYPYNIDHLKCNKCDSTYTLNYKPLWSEDKISLNCSMMNLLEEEFAKRKMEISGEKLDELYNFIDVFLEQFSTGDYRQHH